MLLLFLPLKCLYYFREQTNASLKHDHNIFGKKKTLRSKFMVLTSIHFHWDVPFSVGVTCVSRFK